MRGELANYSALSGILSKNPNLVLTMNSQRTLNGPNSLSLTPQEIKVAYHMLNGKTAKETARLLSISHRTVERHLENIKIKFNCRNKFELVNKILYLNQLE